MVIQQSFQGLLLTLSTTMLTISGSYSAIAQVTQITPDNNPATSLGTVVTPNGTALDITGGTSTNPAFNPTRTVNLFHGFRQFDIFGETANFITPPNVANVFARINGPSSNINGTIQVTGSNANLFLMNPNGIIFGSNASLNIGGSFVATTANTIQFTNQQIFSMNSQRQDVENLLTIQPNAFFFHQIPGPITYNSERTIRPGLEVPEQQSLLFVGGVIQLNGGGLSAPGGNVEIAGVSGIGTKVDLTINGSQLSLNISPMIPRSDVNLLDGATVSTRSRQGGSIAVYAQNLNLLGGSRLITGINANSGSPTSQVGNIYVHTTGKIILRDGSFIENSLQENAKGITGNIEIYADSIELIGQDLTSFEPFKSSGIYNRLESQASGSGGSIKIYTRTLLASKGAGITASTDGLGDPGQIFIEAETITLDGKGEFNPDPTLRSRQSTGIFSAVKEGAFGNEGLIDIKANTLTLTNGAILITSTLGQGKAGNIIIQADKVWFDGEGIESDFKASGAYSQVIKGANGQGGTIRVVGAQLLQLTNGAVMITRTEGTGNAGNIAIAQTDTIILDGKSRENLPGGIIADTRKPYQDGISGGQGGVITITGSQLLQLTNGAIINTRTEKEGGNAGRIEIKETDRIVINKGSVTTDTLNQSDAGSIAIQAEELLVQNGGRVSAESLNRVNGGRAGTLMIQKAELVRVEGAGSELKFDTRSSRSEANAGSLEIFTNRLEVLNGGQVSARTTGFANAGRISIVAPESVLIDGFKSGLFFNSESFGDAQLDGIRVETGHLTIQNQGQMIVDGSGNGATGGLFIAAEAIRMFNQGQLSATTRTGRGGNVLIKIGSGHLIMGGVNANGSPIGGGNEIRARAFGPGDGGSVLIEPLSAQSSGAVISTSFWGDNDILAIAEDGTGGRADAEKVVVVIGFVPFSNQDTPRSDFTARSQFGLDGSTLLPDDQTEEVLPTDFLSSNVALGCRALRAGESQSKFVYTGRGGVPMNPFSSLEGNRVDVGLVSRGNHHEPYMDASKQIKVPRSQSEPIVEAQQWIRYPDGTIELIAQSSATFPMPSVLSDCLSVKNGLDKGNTEF